MDPVQLQIYYEIAIEATKKAGRHVLSKISQKKNIETKGSEIDLVTETDKEVEEMLIKALSNAFPDHKFIGEETAAAEGTIELTDDPTWVIDPVDGTMNFVHSFPHSCISVALFIQKEPVVGIIVNPSLDQFFTAVKGNGAYCNGKRIRVSEQTVLGESLVMMEVGTSRTKEKMDAVFRDFESVIPKVHGIRSLGSAALDMCMVAMGSAEAYFEYGPHIWDMGAGDIIINEAGGIVIDPSGGPLDPMSRRVLCANNLQIAKQLMPLLAQYKPTRD